MSQTKRWQIVTPLTSQADESLAAFPLILRQLLFNRGYATDAESLTFLKAETDFDANPFQMTGLDDPAEVACALLDRGVGTVGLKMGADGCLVISGEGQVIHLPTFQVDVVDATGARDAFAAGFIAGVWQGGLKKTACFANAVGALCVTGLGASGGVRSLSGLLLARSLL